jgi:hypothetical protein
MFLLYIGKMINSLSIAGVFMMDRNRVNGWRLWKYQNSEGKWVALAELLKKEEERDSTF